MKNILVAFITFFATAASAAEFQGPFEINTPGATRQAAKVYLPNNYGDRTDWPVLMMLHGFTASAERQEKYLALSRFATEKGFILVTPEGTKNSKGQQFWNSTDFCCDFEKSGIDDVGYLLGLVRVVGETYKIDPSRVYLMGHSNGGFMANRLLCESDGIFAAAASLAGGTFKNAGDCRIQKPVAYLQIHAEDDDIVKYADEPLYAGALGSVAQRASIARCDANPVADAEKDLIVSIPGKDITPSHWKGCQADVVLWSIHAYKSPLHFPHIPKLSSEFRSEMIDFLLSHKIGG